MIPYKDIKAVAFRDFEIKNNRLYKKIYRILASYLVFIFQFFPITPNMVSLSAIIVTFLGGFFFLKYNIYLFFAGVLMLYLGELLDHADGNLARVTKKTSKIISVLLDDYFHEIPRQFIFFFIGLGGYLIFNKIIYLYLGFIVLVFQLLTMHLSQLRRAVLAMQVNTGFFNEANDNNPFSQSKIKKLGMKIAVFPMKENKLILLISVIITFFVPNFIFNILYFYAPFIFLRFFAFFYVSYKGVQSFEKKIQ